MRRPHFDFVCVSKRYTVGQETKDWRDEATDGQQETRKD